MADLLCLLQKRWKENDMRNDLRTGFRREIARKKWKEEGQTVGEKTEMEQWKDDDRWRG